MSYSVWICQMVYLCLGQHRNSRGTRRRWQKMRELRGKESKALNSEERRDFLICYKLALLTSAFLRSLLTSSKLLASLQVKPRTLDGVFPSLLTQSNIFERCRLNDAYYRHRDCWARRLLSTELVTAKIKTYSRTFWRD